MPVSACNGVGLFLLCLAHTGFEAVVDTGRVSDNQRRAVVSLSLAEGLEGLGLVGAHGYLCAVYITVGRCDKTKVFLADALAGSGEFGDSANGCCLGGLAAGIGVNLGIQDEHIHVLAGGEHVVKTTEADVVSGTVTGDNPL